MNEHTVWPQLTHSHTADADEKEKEKHLEILPMMPNSIQRW